MEKVGVHRMRCKRLFISTVLFLFANLWGLTPCYGIESLIAWPAIDFDSQSIIQASGRLLGVEQEYVQTFQELEGRWDQKGLPQLAIVSDSFVSGLSSRLRLELKEAVAETKVSAMIVLENSEPKGSEGFIDGLTKYVKEKTSGVLNFSAEHAETLKELAGIKIPVTFEEKCVFINIDQEGNSDVEPLIWLQEADGSRHVIMAVKRIRDGRLYFAAFPRCQIISGNETFKDLCKVFPIIIFLKNEGDEFCWHKKTILANLTIDDPWLVEPYGNLSYTAMLKQMEEANFHTTIAFIPWYFDRSQSEVVDLFRKNPERYSIAFHGNNHDRQEFGSYKDHAFESQETNIRQAVARMAEFNRLTGIPIGHVMIFPHGIAPEKTILVLQKYNFIATMNSTILPLGHEGPLSIDSMLWPANFEYNGFPIIQRFNPGVDKSTINILLFLQKPMLFYTHQNYFYEDIRAFNEVAQYVNRRTGGKVIWVDLKQVCNDLYMERLKADDLYEIRMMARSIVIQNLTTKTARYRVKEILSGYKDIEKLTIGNTVYKENIEQELGKSIPLEAGQTIRVELTYKQTPDYKVINVERAGFRNYMIRCLSDFRDRYLSTHWFGRKMIEIINYFLHGSY